MTVVELFGLPGAGKSTVASRLHLPAHAIRREDLVIARKALSAAQRARLLVLTLKDWRWLWALFVLALRTPIQHREGLDRLVRLAVARAWVASQGGLVVLDQGLLQAVWSIFYSENISRPPRHALARVLKLLYAGVSVVLVEIAIRPEFAALRVTGRDNGSSRLDGLPLGTTQRKLQQFGELPAELLAAARQAGLDVRSLSGEEEIDRLTQQLQTLIDEQVAKAA